MTPTSGRPARWPAGSTPAPSATSSAAPAATPGRTTTPSTPSSWPPRARPSSERRPRIIGYEAVTFLHAPDGALANDLAAARAAGGRHPGVPPGRRPDDGPLDALQPLRAHPAHGPPRRGHGRGRRRVPGGPQRDGLPAPGTRRPGAAHGALAVPVLDGSGRRVGGHQRHVRAQAGGPARPRQPDPRSGRPGAAAARVGDRGRRADRHVRGGGLPAPRRRPEISRPWPSATAARGPTGSTGRPASPTAAPGGPPARSATARGPCSRGTRRRPR